jgi:uncharacterized membrane protein
MASTLLAKPEQGERSTAAAVHIGAIFVPIWVPLIAWVVTRKDRPFVAAHARQSLVETLVLNVLIGIAMLGSLAYTVYNVWSMYQEGFDKVDWYAVAWQSLLRLGIWWLAMGVLWLINFFVSLRQALQAYRGEWPRSARKRAARAARV